MGEVQLFDVVAVNYLTKPATVRVMDRGMTARNADAYVTMAVIRRGVDYEFFAEVPAGLYSDGDVWAGKDGQEQEEEQTPDTGSVT